MNVLICFDKFKDSMSASQAGRIVGKVLAEKQHKWAIETVALADGGEGFCEILTTTQHGLLETHTVPGSLLQPIKAQLGWVSGGNLSLITRADWKLSENSKVAIIEMAQATGLQELPINARDCWKTTSSGTGVLIRLAIEQGADCILLGVGGSSTNDLGLGVLEALGLTFCDADGHPVETVRPELWQTVDHIKGALPRNIPSIKIACDVQNPLFGPQGAAAIYGPQKGLKPEDHPKIEKQGKRIARMLCDHLEKPWSLTEAPGSGAAGGITFGLSTACDVELLPGFDLVSQWLNLPEKIDACDWLITGEGKFDASSLQGKGPGTLAQIALSKRKRVTIVAGRIELAENSIIPTGTVDLVEISPREGRLEEILANAHTYLIASISNLLKTKA